MADNRFPSVGVDARFPSPGVDVRFPAPGQDLEHLPDGTDTRFQGATYGEDGAYPVWVQPTGAHDAYPLNALVSHNGANYRSTIPTNTTVPGENVVFGWWVVV